MMIDIIGQVRRIVSRFTDIPIDNGVGVTTDDNFKLTIADYGRIGLKLKQPKRRVSRVTAKYRPTSDSTQVFELIKTNRNESSGKIFYTLQHCASGEKIHITKAMFNTMFTSCQEDKQ